MAIVFEGDFIGFSFNNRHSSEINIKRVSDGSRFNENLLPALQDKTAQVTGGDGTYYWDTSYTQKPFPISFAFDNLSEKQFRELRQWLGVKELCPLIFDEAPYKVYTVKATGTPNLKYICFDKEVEEDKEIELISTENLDGSYVQGAKSSQRVYKGEGSIQFVAYYPYARSQFKSLDKYLEKGYPNVSEWKDASGILTIKELSMLGNKLYNPGDLESDFIATFNFTNKENNLHQIYLRKIPENQLYDSRILTFKAPFVQKEKDYGFRINSKNNLIEGIDIEGKTTGTLYNEYIESGEFFKIPLGDSTSFIADGDENFILDYNYIYY